jgi:hypothetical protein
MKQDNAGQVFFWLFSTNAWNKAIKTGKDFSGAVALMCNGIGAQCTGRSTQGAAIFKIAVNETDCFSREHLRQGFGV